MKKFLKFAGIFLVLIVLASCTQSFCTVSDQAEMMAEYYENNIEQINKQALDNGIYLPSSEFEDYMVKKVNDQYDAVLDNADLINKPSRNFIAFAGYNPDNNYYEELWYNFDMWVEDAKKDLGYEKVASADYLNFFKQQITNAINVQRVCITPVDFTFNNGQGVHLEAKSWGDAFSHGLIEGLLVYPVAWLLHNFSIAFGGNGWGQVLAILVVTIIVRALIVLVSFKQTMAQQKTNLIQPELRRIQEKYPNANTNQYEKAQLAQEQMALYKKYGINPFGMIIVLIVQFPVFIAVWGAMSGTAILADGEILGLSLASTTSSEIFNLDWVAIVIFVLMSAAQIISMKLPMMLQKKRLDAVEKRGKNPAVEKNENTMKWVNNIMMVMIIIMGFSLPVGMAIYWFIGALISIVQTLVIQKINNNKSKGLKYKTKK